MVKNLHISIFLRTFAYVKQITIKTIKNMKATIIIITLAMIQIAPLFLLIASESNFAKLFGFIYGFILAYIWTETKLGKEFLKVWYKCTLHLEKKIFGSNADC